MVSTVVLVDFAEVVHRLVTNLPRGHQFHIVEPLIRVQPRLTRVFLKELERRPQVRQPLSKSTGSLRAILVYF